jgi:tRNA threonylcarbamoyladenosine biosynthesis protein TsaB
MQQHSLSNSRSDERLILGLDTCTSQGSVALAQGERIESRSWSNKGPHSANILVEIDLLLKENRLTIDQIDLFAATVGPGSFTGLRIGLATLMGIAKTLEKKCVGVQTLHAVGCLAGASEVMALLPAARGELFGQLLTVGSNGDVKELSQPFYKSFDEIVIDFGERSDLVWAGEGVERFREIIDQKWRVAENNEVLAAGVCRLALHREKSAVDPEDLKAVYVRPPDVELNR